MCDAMEACEKASDYCVDGSSVSAAIRAAVLSVFLAADTLYVDCCHLRSWAKQREGFLGWREQQRRDEWAKRSKQPKRARSATYMVA